MVPAGLSVLLSRPSDGLGKLLEPLGDQLRQPLQGRLRALGVGGEDDLLAPWAPRPRTASMEAALTGEPSALAIVTGTPVAVAARTKMEAGRAWRPSAQPTLTRRSAM